MLRRGIVASSYPGFRTSTTCCSAVGPLGPFSVITINTWKMNRTRIFHLASNKHCVIASRQNYSTIILRTARIWVAWHSLRSGAQVIAVITTVTWWEIGTKSCSRLRTATTSCTAVWPLCPFSIITVDSWKEKTHDLFDSAIKWFQSEGTCFKWFT